MKDFTAILVIFATLYFIVHVAMSLFEVNNDNNYNNLKQQCAKDNNVFECVIVAVPKGKE